jgi:hypothetical protein
MRKQCWSAGAASIAHQPPSTAFSLISQTHPNHQSTLRPRDQARLNQLQREVLGYSFTHPGLLAQALNHVSVLGAVSYQRLEFLGDALLDLLVSAQLMQHWAEGKLVGKDGW